MTQCFFYSASEFIRKLDKLHRDINKTTALIQEPSPENMINMPRLRAAMDLCIEQLPTLLKIEQDGAVSVTQLLPRVLSQLRALSCRFIPRLAALLERRNEFPNPWVMSCKRYIY